MKCTCDIKALVSYGCSCGMAKLEIEAAKNPKIEVELVGREHMPELARSLIGMFESTPDYYADHVAIIQKMKEELADEASKYTFSFRDPFDNNTVVKSIDFKLHDFGMRGVSSLDPVAVPAQEHSILKDAEWLEVKVLTIDNTYSPAFERGYVSRAEYESDCDLVFVLKQPYDRGYDMSLRWPKDYLEVL